jgi:hypothetical protein
MNGIQRPSYDSLVACRYDRQVYLASFEATHVLDSRSFSKLKLYARMATPVARKKGCKHATDILWVRANSQCSCTAALQCARTFDENVGIGQQATTMPKQIFAFSCQLQVSADAVEKLHAKLSFKSVNLPRRRWLAEM